MIEARGTLSQYGFDELSRWLDLARREIDALAECLDSRRPQR
jgi:hypothetical protein